MKFLRIVLAVIVVAYFTAAGSDAAQEPKTSAQGSGTGAIKDRAISLEKNVIVFTNSKGEVVFNHRKHAAAIKEDGCILCHRTETPDHKNSMSRFDDHRIAHYFCKGCHRETGRGPTECHECHNYRKRK